MAVQAAPERPARPAPAPVPRVRQAGPATGRPAARPVRPAARARVARVSAAQREDYLRRSTDELSEQSPLMSSRETTTRAQRTVGIVLAVVLALCLLLATRLTLVVLIGIATLLYTVVVTYRVLLFRQSLTSGALMSVTDEQALALESLPTYTVLIPAYREPEVIAQLLADVVALDYPARRLDVVLLVEQDDPETLAAIHDAAPPRHVRVVLVPAGEPRTKPKALNYGLCLSTAELVAVFDAEDRPEPLQLRRAVAAFRRLPDDVVCLQARLAFYNGEQNIITKWFQGEYLSWFRFFLPGLAERGVPLPLGGTSNHLRREVLVEIGGWDPFNVTEDADLGIRLHRAGYRSAVLDSDTLEEANSDFVNWAKQRSRWHKGYLQTWLVHMRHPRRLWRELGPSGFLNFNLFVGGTPLLALLNPVFWALTILWFVTQSAAISSLFPPLVYYPALAAWVLGNGATVYLSLLGVQEAEQPQLGLAALASPLYWVMMSVAAYKALWQLCRNPSLWEKTAHGLSPARPALAVVDDVA